MLLQSTSWGLLGCHCGCRIQVVVCFVMFCSGLMFVVGFYVLFDVSLFLVEGIVGNVVGMLLNIEDFLVQFKLGQDEGEVSSYILV